MDTEMVRGLLLAKPGACGPHHGAALRASYPAIQPGYHMNKQHWITLTLNGSLSPELVQSLIDESYQLVVAGLPRATRASLQASLSMQPR